MRFGLIYRATCIVTGKHYVGQSTSYKRRIVDHFGESKREKSTKYRCKFYSAIRRYGWENFDWEILEDNIPEELLNIKECEWIQGLNSCFRGLNSTLGGEVTFKDKKKGLKNGKRFK